MLLPSPRERSFREIAEAWETEDRWNLLVYVTWCYRILARKKSTQHFLHECPGFHHGSASAIHPILNKFPTEGIQMEFRGLVDFLIHFSRVGIALGKLYLASQLSLSISHKNILRIWTQMKQRSEWNKSWHKSFSNSSWPRNSQIIKKTSGRRVWDEGDISEWNWASRIMKFCRKEKEGWGINYNDFLLKHWELETTA